MLFINPHLLNWGFEHLNPEIRTERFTFRTEKKCQILTTSQVRSFSVNSFNS